MECQTNRMRPALGLRKGGTPSRQPQGQLLYWKLGFGGEHTESNQRLM
jgi:hypothetical protein